MEPVPNVEIYGQLFTQFYEEVLSGHFSYVDSQMGLKTYLKVEPSETPKDQHEKNEVEFDLNKVKIEQVEQVDSCVNSQMGLKTCLKVEPVDHSELSFDIKIEETDAIDLEPKQEPCDKFYLAPIDHEVSARLCYPCETCQYNPYTYPTRRQKRLEQFHKTCDPVLQ